MKKKQDMTWVLGENKLTDVIGIIMYFFLVCGTIYSAYLFWTDKEWNDLVVGEGVFVRAELLKCSGTRQHKSSFCTATYRYPVVDENWQTFDPPIVITSTEVTICSACDDLEQDPTVIVFYFPSDPTRIRGEYRPLVIMYYLFLAGLGVFLLGALFRKYAILLPWMLLKEGWQKYKQWRHLEQANSE